MIIGYFNYKFNKDFTEIKGEFFNNYSIKKQEKIKTNAKKENDKDKNLISGIYTDTWEENETINMKLEIKKDKEFYILEWNEGSFIGFGVLVENNIISGFYSDDKTLKYK
jgi:hypothetical protein